MNISKKRLPFITIEGVDGAGKSSHVDTVVKLVESCGLDVVTTREPGGTELGERLREEMLNSPMALQTTVLLAFASRSEHLDKVITPALESNKAVVCDRFTDSTFSYQGAGQGYPLEEIEMLEKMVQKGLQPDFTLLFDLPVKESMKRLSGTGKIPDNFEKQPPEFFQRVRDAYLSRTKEGAGRIKIIDSSVSLEEVSEQVKKEVFDFLVQWGLTPIQDEVNRNYANSTVKNKKHSV